MRNLSFPSIQRGRQPLALSLFALALTAGCGGSGGDGNNNNFFASRDTGQAVGPNTEIQVVGRWLAFLADEATSDDPAMVNPGTDFNGNGTFTDQVPVAVNMVTNTVHVLGAAAEEVHLLDDQVYLVVDESDDMVDWNTDMDQGDMVLLVWSEANQNLTFVDEIDDDGVGPMALTTDGRLYYTAEATLGMGETALRFVEDAAPTVTNTVFKNDNAAFEDVSVTELTPYLWGHDEGILFVYLDETVEGVDLNGDTDATDPFVAALHDTTSVFTDVQNTGLAINGVDAPFRARFSEINMDWIVAFLANEASNGLLMNGGYNDPGENAFGATFVPLQCATDDADLNDDVLHWIPFTAWLSNPVTDPPQNTGLAGISTVAAGGRVVMTPSPVSVATIQLESDQGGCDLNDDGDSMDMIVRWVEAAGAPTYFTDEDELVAITDVDGGTQGLAELDRVLVAVVDEAADGRDHNGDGNQDLSLYASIDPNNGLAAAWTYDHDFSAGTLFIQPDYLVEEADRGRILSTVDEVTFATSLNFSDTDLDDTIPAISTYNNQDVDFAVTRVATVPSAAGIISYKGVLFYRASEAMDDRDWNSDGDETDEVLLRTTESSGFTAFVSLASASDGPALMADPESSDVFGGAYLANEADAATDFNQDGDMNDFVVRHFRF